MLPLQEAVEPLATPAAHAVFGAIGLLLIATLARELPKIPKQLLVLMATAFVDMVGVFLVLPLLPYYVMRLAGDGVEVPLFGVLEANTLIGIIASAFTVAQLLSAPLWGRLSDRLGRRPVLLVALFASAIAYLIFGFADSLWLLLLSRLVQGAGGGTVGVIQAYVADSVEPEQRARGLGWLSAATNLGVALGPVIGSLLVAFGKFDLMPGEATLSLGRTAPGIGAAVLCLLNMVFAAKYLPESRPAPAAAAPAPVSARHAAWTVVVRFKEQGPRLIWIYAIAIGSFQGIMPMLAPSLKVRFGITEQTIGHVFMWIGAISVWARVLLLGRLVDRFGEARVARFGIVVLSAGLFGMAWAGSLWTLAVTVALLPIGAALTFPCVTGLLSRTVAPGERGLYMGLQQTFGGATRAIAPVLYGWTSDTRGEAVPFQVAAALVLSTSLLAMGLGAVRDRRSRDILSPPTKGGS